MKLAVPDWDIDVAELGERAVIWADRESLGSLYSQVEDRAWAVVLDCYAKCVVSLGAENVPAEWRPQFDEHGRWHMPA